MTQQKIKRSPNTFLNQLKSMEWLRLAKPSKDFPKMFKGCSQQTGTRIEKLRHTVLHEERVNGTFLAIVSALWLKDFSHFL